MLHELFSALEEAHRLRAPETLVTPLLHSPALSQLLGLRVLLKAEHLQTTGSFKYRGAANKLRCLSTDQRARGVVTASSGNHGMALARAAAAADVPLLAYVSASAASSKVRGIIEHGADLVRVAGDGLAAELAALASAQASGRLYVSPYNDLQIIAGQGTLGLEIVDQVERLDTVFVSVGGGGLAAGVGAALALRAPGTELVGCWPVNAPALLRALDTGRIHDVDEYPTLSDGTAGGVEPGTVTLPLCQRLMGRRVEVSETAIAQALYLLAEHEHWMVEGAAGVALAGLMQLAPTLQGKTVVVVLCGRNISPAAYMHALAQGQTV